MSEETTNEVINICGVLIHAIPDQITQVQERLLQYEGVEVHNVTENGRLIVTIDHPDRHLMADTISDLNNVEGVLSASMIYQHNE